MPAGLFIDPSRRYWGEDSFDRLVSAAVTKNRDREWDDTPQINDRPLTGRLVPLSPMSGAGEDGV
jgi:hypothetical protein